MPGRIKQRSDVRNILGRGEGFDLEKSVPLEFFYLRESWVCSHTLFSAAGLVPATIFAAVARYCDAIVMCKSDQSSPVPQESLHAARRSRLHLPQSGL